MSESARIMQMEPQKPAMGRQIEYEIFYGKDEKAHPPVDISIGMEDSIHWFCRDRKFRVLSVNPSPKNPDAPPRLFYRKFPDDNPDFAYHVNSGPARADSGSGYEYKPIFEFDDDDCTQLDPHIRTNP